MLRGNKKATACAVAESSTSAGTKITEDKWFPLPRAEVTFFEKQKKEALQDVRNAQS